MQRATAKLRVRVSGSFSNPKFYDWLDNDAIPTPLTEFKGTLCLTSAKSSVMMGKTKDQLGKADVVAHFLDAKGTSCDCESATYMMWWKTYRMSADKEAAPIICYFFAKEEGGEMQSAWKGCYTTSPVENQSTTGIAKCVLTVLTK